MWRYLDECSHGYKAQKNRFNRSRRPRGFLNHCWLAAARFTLSFASLGIPMRETLKVLCVVIFMFAAPAAALGWFDRADGAISLFLRYGCPVLALAGIVGFLKIHLRADLVPDYLYHHSGTYFNRGGFCFGIRANVIDGVCYLEVLFQNQQDEHSVGRIALRPARGFFLGRANIEPIALEIQCQPAAFGTAKVAVRIPDELQGKRQSFEVGASVDYPNGKGRTLRFRDGIVLRANSNFGNTFGTALTVAGALTGSIVWTTPTQVTIDLPPGVNDVVADASEPETQTFWKLGDQPVAPAKLTIP